MMKARQNDSRGVDNEKRNETESEFRVDKITG